MTNREIRAEAKQRIRHGKQSHQEVFDHLKAGVLESDQHLAYILSKEPSRRIIAKFNYLNWIYVTGFSIQIVLKGIQASRGFVFIDWNLFIGLGISIAIPILGIIGALKHVKWSYTIMAALYSLFFLVVLINMKMFTPRMAPFMISYLLVIIFGFIIPSKLITPYSKKIHTENRNGELINSVIISFDEDREVNDDILDKEVLDDVFLI